MKALTPIYHGHLLIHDFYKYLFFYEKSSSIEIMNKKNICVKSQSKFS